MVNLQQIFAQPILEQVYLDPGYSGHANDIWRVRTRDEDVIVRLHRAGEGSGPFWSGCHELFGIAPGQPWELQAINTSLAAVSTIPIPRVLRKGEIEGRHYVIVERMAGKTPASFQHLPERAISQLGLSLAAFHQRRQPVYGHLVHAPQAPIMAFHGHLATTLRHLVASFPMNDPALIAALEPMCAAAARLPEPESGVPVMIDLDPTQYLADAEGLTALVDTEAIALAPRELDFIALEYLLDARTASIFAHAYSTALPLPKLSSVRPVYRYLYRLLEVQGDPSLDEWMAQPHLFD